jgi:hypothetical protein
VAKGYKALWCISLGLLGLLLELTACGGGGGGGGDAAPYNPLWISIDTQNLDMVVTTSQVELRDSAYCDACPPSEAAFGYCPPILPPRSSAVTVSWTNLTTGARGTAGNAISGSCACLFSNCMTVYGNHWAVYDLPLAIGENVIEIRVSYGGNAATDTVSFTRIPAASQGLVATAGKGEVTLQWNSVAAATSNNLY